MKENKPNIATVKANAKASNIVAYKQRSKRRHVGAALVAVLILEKQTNHKAATKAVHKLE